MPTGTSTGSKADWRPDEWVAGLRFGGKCLSTKSVDRAKTPAEVLPVCLAHNLRQNNKGHRHRSRIDPSRSPSNEVHVGPADLAVAVELVANVMDELSIKPTRRDSIMGVELVFQPPEGGDLPSFWRECLSWAMTMYEHVVSAVVHRDQKRPHMHLIALAIEGGKLAGNALTSGARRLPLQRRAFLAHMRGMLGMRTDRKVKTLAELAVSTGHGPKTKAAADRADLRLSRCATKSLTVTDVGMGVDGHGGPPIPQSNPHAHAQQPTPLLRSLPMPSEWRDVMLRLRQTADPQRPPLRPTLSAPWHLALQPRPADPGHLQEQSV